MPARDKSPHVVSSSTLWSPLLFGTGPSLPPDATAPRCSNYQGVTRAKGRGVFRPEHLRAAVGPPHKIFRWSSWRPSPQPPRPHPRPLPKDADLNHGLGREGSLDPIPPSPAAAPTCSLPDMVTLKEERIVGFHQLYRRVRRTGQVHLNPASPLS